MAIQIKRIYDPATKDDGYRLLVDRLWPRGISKEKAALDEWAKELAPDSALRTWFGHKAENFHVFADLYQKALDKDPVVADKAAQLIAKSKNGTVTLLYGAKDPMINHAAVLKNWLENKAKNLP